jgi:hypothetical protein
MTSMGRGSVVWVCSFGVLLVACESRQKFEDQQGAVLSAGLVRLVAQHSGKCLEVVGTTGSVAATQDTCNGSSSQQWMLRAVSGGYQIVSAIDNTRCLNLPGANATPGSGVFLSGCSAAGAPGEIWNPTAVGANYNLIATHSAQCMDVSNVSMANGATVIEWTCNGGLNQQWAVQAVASSTPDAGADGQAPADAGSADGRASDAAQPPASDGGAASPPSVRIVAQHSGKCLEATGAAGQSSAAVQDTCNGGTRQIWSLAPVTGGFRIVSAFDGTRCLNLPGATTTPGSAVFTSTCSAAGTPGEIWSEAALGANFHLVAGASMQCLDVNGASTADGAAVIQWTCNGGLNQQWALQPTTPPPPPPPPPADAGAAADAGTPPPPPPPPPADAGTAAASTVRIVAQHSGKCLEATGAAGQSSAAVQDTCNGGTRQIWSLAPVTGGFRIVSAFDGTRCLNLPGATTTPGSAVFTSTCSAAGAPGEIWTEAALGANWHLIASASMQCLDVSGVSLADGAAVIQWTCNGGLNQQWVLQPTQSPPPPPPPPPSSDAGTDGGAPADARSNGGSDARGGTDASPTSPPPADGGAAGRSAVRIVAQHSGKCLEETGAAGQSSAAVQDTCNGGARQTWSLTAVAGGYRIVSAFDGTRCLNLPGAATAPGSSVFTSACSAAGVPGEIWNPSAVGANYNLIATHSAQCMDVSDVSIADGAAIIQWTCNGGTNQQWALQATTPPPPPADAGVDASSAPPDARTPDARTPDAGSTAPGDGGVSTLAPLELIAQHSNDCLGISWPAGANAPITQGLCNGSSNQRWLMKPVTGGYQIISSIDASRCFTVAGGSQTLGTAVLLSNCSANGAPGEVWSPRPVGSNFNLSPAGSSGLCLDVADASMASGAGILQWSCSGALNQLWAMRPMPELPDPTVAGRWSPIIGLPSIGLAAAVLPDGNVLTWASWARDTFGGVQPNQTYTALFNTQTLLASEALVTETSHDMFCPGTAMLPDGRVLVNGGGPDVASTSIYTAPSTLWTGDSLMHQPRWYNSSVTLPDGRVFTLGGNLLSGLDGRGEIWSPGAGWTVVPGAVMDPLLTTDPVNRSQEHPRLFVAPNGKIFVPGPTPNMQWYDHTGNGSVQSAGRRGDDDFSQNDVTVLYDVGKLLKAGGNVNYDRTGAAQSPSSANAYVIDINGGGLAAVHRIPSLAHGRAFANGVILPDGRVLVTGGLDNGKGFSDVGATLTPELFDPATETWRDLAAMDVSRPYHSVAVLLPDGRVFQSGGGLCGTGCVANHFDLQLFSPPYLFRGARPQITSAPSVAGWGATLNVLTSGAVTAFTWVRMSSTTHTVNTDQRFLRASSTALGSGAFSVVTPASANLAPPGYYMLFALDGGGTPSVAKVMRLGP